jgi:hypothetical protein
MDIHVIGDDTISSQARTYAEYRVFSALARRAAAEPVLGARVVIRRPTTGRARHAVTCTVSMAVAGARPIRVRGVGSHPYAAINRAVERLGGARTSHLIGSSAVETRADDDALHAAAADHR